MDIRVQRLPKKNSDQSPIQSTTCFSVKGQSCWNSHEFRVSQSFSKNSRLKVESPPHLCQEAKHSCLQLQDRDSSSTQSTGQSHHEVTTVGGINSQDQCISSDSVHEESHGKCIEGQLNPLFLTTNPNFIINPSRVDISQTMTRIPYNYADPYLSALFTACGPEAVVQPQVMGVAPGRVPLPLDLAEDGPIYVNAKQYHGILRRRQTGAKLEAQNKLVKNRRPFLHESRHLHALNRVRSSGGRFLSTKKQRKQSPSSSPCHSSDSSHFCQKGGMSEFGMHQSETDTSVVDNKVLFQRQDHRFSGISPRTGVAMQGMCNGTWPRAPVVR